MRSVEPGGAASYGRGRTNSRFSPWPASQAAEAAMRPRAAARRCPAAASTQAAPADAQIDPNSVAPRASPSAAAPRSRLPQANASAARPRAGPADVSAPTARAAPPSASARKVERASTPGMMRESGNGVTEARVRKEGDDGPPRDPGGGRSERIEDSRSAINAKQVVIAILAIVLIVFAIANFRRVRVNFLLFDTEARLVTVIVVAAALGFVIGYFVGRPNRLQRRRLKEWDERHDED